MLMLRNGIPDILNKMWEVRNKPKSTALITNMGTAHALFTDTKLMPHASVPACTITNNNIYNKIRFLHKNDAFYY